MNITLVQPAKFKDLTHGSEHWGLSKPSTLLYLAAAIDKDGKHSWTLIDFELVFLENPKQSMREILKEAPSEVFGVTATTFTRFDAIKVVCMIRELFPKAVIIVGGVHFMHCAEDALEKISAIDIVVRGEGEKVIVNLLDAIQNKTSLAGVKGISYRSSDLAIVSNPDEADFEDLDSLEIHTLMSPVIYPEQLFGSNSPEVSATSIMTSRGCPYNCIFCSKSGMKYRFRTTESVIKEIKYYIDNYNIRAFNFLDLTFTADPSRTKDLCEKIIEEGLAVEWWCESRANIPVELIPLMAKAGCRYLFVGVESGSDRILSRLGKNINLPQVNAFLDVCLENGIQVTASFMFSHPSETLQDARETVKYIKTLSLRGIVGSFQPCMIFPGTKIEKMALKSGLLDGNFSWNQEVNFEINKRLGQLSNVPLFFDQLSYEDMCTLMDEYNEFMQMLYLKRRWSKLSIKKIVSITRKKGIAGVLFSIVRDFGMLLRGIHELKTINNSGS